VLGAVIAAGLAVAIIATLSLRPHETAQLAHYAVAPDGRQLTVTAAMGRLETIESTSVQEGPTTVKIIVLISRRSGTAPADIQLVDLPIALTSPLGGRTVTDANDNPIPLKVTGP